MSLYLLEELIESGNRTGLENLINSHPDLLQKQTSFATSPLLLACYYQQKNIIQLILQNIKGINLYEAAALGMHDELKLMLVNNPEYLDQYAPHGFTALGIATHFNQEDAVRLLLSLHANPNLPSQNGFDVCPLHIATHQNFTQIGKLLIEAGANVNVFQNQKNTPLHFAAMNGNIELIIHLLENGAQVEVRNEMGETPSDLATQKGFIEIGKILSA